MNNTRKKNHIKKMLKKINQSRKKINKNKNKNKRKKYSRINKYSRRNIRKKHLHNKTLKRGGARDVNKDIIENEFAHLFVLLNNSIDSSDDAAADSASSYKEIYDKQQVNITSLIQDVIFTCCLS